MSEEKRKKISLHPQNSPVQKESDSGQDDEQTDAEPPIPSDSGDGKEPADRAPAPVEDTAEEPTDDHATSDGAKPPPEEESPPLGAAGRTVNLDMAPRPAGAKVKLDGQQSKESSQARTQPAAHPPTPAEEAAEEPTDDHATSDGAELSPEEESPPLDAAGRTVNLDMAPRPPGAKVKIGDQESDETAEEPTGAKAERKQVTGQLEDAMKQAAQSLRTKAEKQAGGRIGADDASKEAAATVKAHPRQPDKPPVSQDKDEKADDSEMRETATLKPEPEAPETPPVELDKEKGSDDSEMRETATLKVKPKESDTPPVKLAEDKEPEKTEKSDTSRMKVKKAETGTAESPDGPDDRTVKISEEDLAEISEDSKGEEVGGGTVVSEPEPEQKKSTATLRVRPSAGKAPKISLKRPASPADDGEGESSTLKIRTPDEEKSEATDDETLAETVKESPAPDKGSTSTLKIQPPKKKKPRVPVADAADTVVEQMTEPGIEEGKEGTSTLKIRPAKGKKVSLGKPKKEAVDSATVKISPPTKEQLEEEGTSDATVMPTAGDTATPVAPKKKSGKLSLKLKKKGPKPKVNLPGVELPEEEDVESTPTVELSPPEGDEETSDTISMPESIDASETAQITRPGEEEALTEPMEAELPEGEEAEVHGQEEDHVRPAVAREKGPGLVFFLATAAGLAGTVTLVVRLVMDALKHLN